MPALLNFSQPLADVLSKARSDAQRAALQRFDDHGLPHPRMERWKYTNPSKALTDQTFILQPARTPLPAPLAKKIEAIATPRLVLHNGVIDPDTSHDVENLLSIPTTPPAVTGNCFAELSIALSDAPFSLALHKNTHLTIVHVIAGDQPTAAFSCGMIEIAGEAQIDEIFLSPETPTGHLACPGLMMTLAPGARVNRQRIIDAPALAMLATNDVITIPERATCRSFTANLRGQLLINETHARLAGAGGDARISGCSITRAHVDNTSLVEHIAPSCTSRSVFYSIASDKGRIATQGKIHVHRTAQQTDGYQMSRGLLLSKQAEIDHKPELEIYADDVKCSHGATVGELDKDALFYLRARGIYISQARQMLIKGFVHTAIDEITDDDARARVTQAADQAVERLAQSF
ncbi:MAG: SufD family Fe-S cluster assembly protein [Pseudomonadota bacterium]